MLTYYVDFTKAVQTRDDLTMGVADGRVVEADGEVIYQVKERDEG